MDRQTLTGVLELFSSQIWMSFGGAAAHTIGKLLRYGHGGLVVGLDQLRVILFVLTKL